MSSKRPPAQKQQVYAVVRVDLEWIADADSPDQYVTVKEILPSQSEAESETARLNELSDGTYVYFWQASRLFPDGRVRRAS